MNNYLRTHTFNLSIIQKLLHQEINLNNIRDKYGNTALIHCAKYAKSNSYYNLLEKLIELKLDINLQNQNGETALICASLYSNTTSSNEAVKRLLKAKSNLNLFNTYGETALHCAVMYCSSSSSIETVKLLLHSNINQPDFNGNTPLISSIIFYNTTSSIEATKLLIDKKANLNHRDIYGNTALMYACSTYENYYIAKLLIEKKANVNIINDMNETALYLACYFSFERIIPILILAKADVNIHSNGMTPLMITKSYNIAKQLIQAKADVNSQDNQQLSILMLECMEPVINIRKIKLLVENKMDLHLRDANGNTALFYCKNKKLAKYLIKSGLNPNLQNKNGNNILMYNIITNNEFVFYIKYVNLHTRNNAGLTAYDLLKMKNPYSKYLKKIETNIQTSKCYNQNHEKYKHLFSTIEYTDDKNTYIIHILTIPKGTVLFRAVEDEMTDYCGLNTDNKYCLHKNHNVFFYFYPFYSEEYVKNDKMNAYVITENIQLVNLTCPSVLTHTADFNENVIKPCNIVEPKLCKKYIGRSYDPCFTSEFLKRHPNIMGYIGISNIDEKVNDTKYKTTPISFYSTMWADHFRFGIPEIVLFPMKERPKREIYMTKKECMKHAFNYELLFSETYPVNGNIPMKYLKSDFVKRLKQYLSPNSKQHMTIYKPLMTFVIYEMLEDKQNCIPISYSIDAKLLAFQNDIYTDSAISVKNMKYDKTLKRKIKNKYLKTRKHR